MPNLLRRASSFPSRYVARLFGRFADPRLRFRLAVSTGFVIVAAGFLVIGADQRFGVAQSIWNLLGLPDGGLQRQAADQPVYREAPARHRRHTHVVHRAHYDRPAVAQPAALAGKSYCVRLCDGFAFPIGTYNGEGDRATHEAACQSDCPGARTALYVLPAGSDTLADATKVGTGQLYSQMPVAFRYTTYVDEACTCHPAGGGAARSVLRDFTLRRGDAVMTSQGLQVFHGGAGYPFKRRDFVALGKSRDVRRADRGTLRAIERASLVSPSDTTPTKTPAVARRDATHGLEHQARNDWESGGLHREPLDAGLHKVDIP